MYLIQIAQRADDLSRATAFYTDLLGTDAAVDRLRAQGHAIESEPHVIFTHEDDTLGPAGTDEWQAFVRDSEGNLVGLIEHRATAAAPEDDDSGLM